MMKRFVQGASVLAMVVAATPLMAEDAEPDRMAGGNEVVVLSEWAYNPLYERGWSINDVIGETDVVGPNGDTIGEVENLVISDDGQIVAMIAEVGGFWDLGDTHVSIPWDEVQLSPDIEQMRVPIDEETADDYMAFGERSVLLKEQAGRIVAVEEETETGTKVFKATDLVGDYAYLNDGVQYGYVDDLLVANGKVSAVVIDAQGYARPGYYAYPYYPYATWNPYGVRYQIPYTSAEIATIDTFDYDQMKRRPDGTAGSASSGANEDTSAATSN